MYNRKFNLLKWRQCKFSFLLDFKCVIVELIKIIIGKIKIKLLWNNIHEEYFWYWVVLSSWNNDLTFKNWHCKWPALIVHKKTQQIVTKLNMINVVHIYDYIAYQVLCYYLFWAFYVFF